MQRINWSRVILGGLAAGVVINFIEFILNGVILQQQWAEALRALGKPAEMTGFQILWFNVWGFLTGITAVYVYAAIRPRYGPGPSTAADAAIVVWFIGSLLASIFPIVSGLYPIRLMAIGVVVGLIETIAATELGAWLYKEQLSASSPRSQTAGAAT